jgi:glycogen synthase
VQPAENTRLPEDNHSFLVAMVSRLVEAKGIDLVRYSVKDFFTSHPAHPAGQGRLGL